MNFLDKFLIGKSVEPDIKNHIWCNLFETNEKDIDGILEFLSQENKKYCEEMNWDSWKFNYRKPKFGETIIGIGTKSAAGTEMYNSCYIITTDFMNRPDGFVSHCYSGHEISEKIQNFIRSQKLKSLLND